MISADLEQRRTIVTGGASGLGLATVRKFAKMGSTVAMTDLDSQSEELWSEALSINLLSAFRTSHAAAPFLKESSGAIVNTSSMAGWRGGGSSSPYSVGEGYGHVLVLFLAVAMWPASSARTAATYSGLARSPTTRQPAAEK